MADCYGDIDFCLGFLVVHFFSQEIIFLSSVIPIRLGQAYIFVPVSYTVPWVGEKVVLKNSAHNKNIWQAYSDRVSLKTEFYQCDSLRQLLLPIVY